MKITVVGTGYVGLSLAVLLSIRNKVIALDILKDRVGMINAGVSPIHEKEITKILHNNKNLIATTDEKTAYKESQIVVVCTPTNYNPKNNKFDTSSINKVVKNILKVNKRTLIVIKSTIPTGYTDFLKKKFSYNKIIFSPEFLREGHSIKDNTYPSRIIIGDKTKHGIKVANMLLSISKAKKTPVFFMRAHEAEAIKLFSNTYLALRVSFFNELDSYCEVNNISSYDVIKGVSFDPRIGDYYNNPSFGYGGYCLPKDTKQLLANYKNIPNNIIEATVKANNTRKKFIANNIIKRKPKVLGIFKLSMKKDSDNFRQSAILDVLNIIKKTNKKIKIIIYEPSIEAKSYFGFEINNNLDKFKKVCDLVITNRKSKNISDIKNKLYTRDLFESD